MFDNTYKVVEFNKGLWCCGSMCCRAIGVIVSLEGSIAPSEMAVCWREGEAPLDEDSKVEHQRKG